MTWVFDFAEGSKDQKDLLGGKGANLAEMTNLGLPVPPGFTITTETCRAYLAEGGEPEGLAEEVTEHLASLEEAMGRKLGDSDDPLLVSVRSGAKFSMPGMMETVLNVGLNDTSVGGLAARSESERFAHGLLPPTAADVRRHRAPRRVRALLRGARRGEEGQGHRERPRPRRRRPARTGRDVQGHHQDRDRPRLPAGPARADGPRDPGGLRLLEHRPRAALPPPGAHPRGPRHRGQRAGDGLRQLRHGLRLRRRLHPRPCQRRPGRVRRLPPERPGRGRRRRHPQHGVAGRHGRDRPRSPTTT